MSEELAEEYTVVTYEFPEVDEDAPMYIAHARRNEVDGNLYQIGDLTSLAGLSVDEIGYVVGRAYYGCVNPDTLSDELVAAIDKERG